MRSNIELIVGADEPALFFTSLKQAELYLEPIDIENDVYKSFFGPGGEIYSAQFDDKSVYIVYSRHQEPDPSALRELLEKFLGKVGIDFLPSQSLDDLLCYCEKYVVR